MKIRSITIVSSQGVKQYFASHNVSIEDSIYRIAGDPCECFKVFKHKGNGTLDLMADIRCLHNLEIEYYTEEEGE